MRLAFRERVTSRATSVATIRRCCAFLIIPICLLAIACGPLDPTSRSKLEEIKIIWATLPLYHGMIEVNHSASSGFGRAFMSKSFRSEASYDEIKRFYSERLARVGWQLARERPLKDWNKDLGGQLIEFRNGEFGLSIEYAGQKADYGWNYGIGITWPASQ